MIFIGEQDCNQMQVPLMELNIVYNKDYIKSGGQWSRDLFLKLSIILVRKNLRIVKNIIFFPKRFIQSKLSEFKRYIMS